MMLIASNDAITYFSDFRIDVANENLVPTPDTKYRTIRELVSALNEQRAEQQIIFENSVRSQLEQQVGIEISQPEQELLNLIRVTQPTVAVDARFIEGSLIIIGTITITIVLRNPTMRGLLLSIGGQLLARLATNGLSAGIRRILQHFGWSVGGPIVVLVPTTNTGTPPAIIPVPTAQMPTAPSMSQGAPITLLAVIAFLLFAIFVTMLVLGFTAHIL